MKTVGRINLNSARLFIGRYVNLHLKDGSVIINVLIANVQRKSRRRNIAVFYAASTKKVSTVSLKEIDWAEPLNPALFPLKLQNWG